MAKMNMKKIGVLVMALVMMGGLVGCGTKTGQSLDRTITGVEGAFSNSLGSVAGPKVGVAVLGAVAVLNLASDLKSPAPEVPQDTSWMDEECAKVNPQNGQIDRSGCK